jgi:hypothetical protein
VTATLLDTPLQLRGTRLAACECDREGCSATFWITQRQLERVRRQGRTLVAHAHLSPFDDIVGIADHYLVVADPAGRSASHEDDRHSH